MKEMKSMKKERRRGKMKKMMTKEEGFTLVELLIVVIILGILAAVAIPQFGSSTDDAKLSTLQSDLSSLRNAVELYYHQHNSTYPGAVQIDGVTPADDASCPAAFTQQLTLYTDLAGVPAVASAPGLKGPYLKKTVLPKNPYNELDTVKCDTATNDITDFAAIDGSTGWVFYTRTGRLLSNVVGHQVY